MKKILCITILFSAAACGSGKSSDNSSDTATTNSVKGNSPGSNVIEMDTMHMDTAGNKALSDSSHR
jgi:hypothetical protein